MIESLFKLKVRRFIEYCEDLNCIKPLLTEHIIKVLTSHFIFFILAEQYQFTEYQIALLSSKPKFIKVKI